jgi:hypothetical protein
MAGKRRIGNLIGRERKQYRTSSNHLPSSVLETEENHGKPSGLEARQT